MTRKVVSFASNIFFQSSMVFSQLIVVPFFIYSWGVEGYGEWLLLIAPLTLSMYGDLGVYSFLSNRVNKCFEGGQYRKRLLLISNGYMISSITSLFCILILNGVSFLYNGEDYFLELVFFSLYWLLFSSSNFLVNSSRAYIYYPVMVLSISCLNYLTLAIVVSALLMGASIDVIPYFYFFSGLLGFLFVCVAYNHFSPLRIITRLRFVKYYRCIFSGAFYAFLFPSITTGWLQASILLLGKLTTPDVVVFFSTSRVLMRTVVQLSNVFNSVFWGDFTRIFKGGKKRGSIHDITKKWISSVAVCLLAWAVVTLIGGWLIKLWVSISIDDYGYDFYIISISAMFTSFWTLLGLRYMVVNKHNNLVSSYCYSLVIGVAMFLLFRTEQSFIICYTLIELIMLLILSVKLYREFNSND